MQKALVKFKHR